MRPMRSTPDAPEETRPAIEPALIEEWALSYLERYASSAENLRRILRRRVRRRLGHDDVAGDAAMEVIDALVARYVAAGLLDDAAYAAGRARRGPGRGRSLRHIAADLATKGVGRAEVAVALAALREAASDPDLGAAGAFARRRRLGPFRREPLGCRADAVADRRRELAAFARAGFSRQVAEAILGCADAAAVDALLASAEQH
jgi:regulatory protein